MLCQHQSNTVMKHVLLVAFIFLSVSLFAQNTAISGKVLDNKKHPLPGASITIKDAYDGATADSSGSFHFATTEKGAHILVVSSSGYKTIEQPINLNGTLIHLDFSIKEEVNELKAVVVTGGSFEASDAKKATLLSSMDIVTTASANGDINSALKTLLPGIQRVGESGELFVRGGTGDETRQFIDGTTVANPLFAGAPDIATRGRFSPFLFKGTVFSSGGYSALYGQALSAALILESIDLPDRSSASASISPLFWGAQYQSLAKDKKSSWGGSYNYTNVALYFKAVKQTPDYFAIPQFHNGDFNFRVKTSANGMLKFYGSYGYSNLGLRNPDIDSSILKNAFGVQNNNLYTNLSYREKLANHWKMNLGFSFSSNRDGINQTLENAANQPVIGNLPNYLSMKTFGLVSKNLLAQGKVVIEHKFNGLNAIRFGTEYWYSTNTATYNSYYKKITDNFNAVFAEGDVYISNDLAAKAGLRVENSTYIGKANIAPRFSLAYKMNKAAQLTADYGIFYQKPTDQYLLYNNSLNYMKATHYILTYQKADAFQTFRSQLFYKKYNQLLTTNNKDTTNGGTGYADGIEIFWRDKKTLKNFDYWITYSYLDTKRQYLNYPYSITPYFAAKHTANFVVKKFFTKMNTQLNANYSFATGRPYYDFVADNSGKTTIKDQGQTIAFNSLSLSANYLTNIGKAFAVIVLSVTNVLNSHQVYGYNYSYNGQNKAEINPPAKQIFFIGAFLSWGTDRRQDAINNNL